LTRFWCDPKLAQALGWGPALKREVETAMVVFVLPLAELLGELGRGPEDHAPVELVFVRPMAALDLSIGLGVAPRNLPVDDPEIPQVPGEVSPKLGAMVCLDALDGHRQAAAHFLDELSSRFDGIVSIDAKHAIPGGLIDGRELVEAAATELEVLDIDLDRLPGDVDLAPAAGAWAMRMLCLVTLETSTFISSSRLRLVRSLSAAGASALARHSGTTANSVSSATYWTREAIDRFIDGITAPRAIRLIHNH